MSNELYEVLGEGAVPILQKLTFQLGEAWNIPARFAYAGPSV